MLIKEYGSDIYDYHQSFLNNTLPYSDDSAIMLRSGRDALKCVAKQLSGQVDEVWLPAFSCSSMVKPFIDFGYRVRFYGIFSEDAQRTFSYVINNAPNGAILLYMAYFGRKLFTDDMLMQLSEKYILIEDKTQGLFDDSISQFEADYTIASIRKWFAVFDGGYIKTKTSRIDVDIEDPDSYYVNLRRQAFDLKEQYFGTGDIEVKKMYRAVFSKAEEYLYACTDIARMSPESLEIAYAQDYESIRNARKKNCQTLYSKLCEAGYESTIFNNMNSIPLYFAFLVPDRRYMQTELAKVDIYCPHIWPIPNGANKIQDDSEYLSNHLLCVHCDQRYTASDMKFVSDRIIELLGEYR